MISTQFKMLLISFLLLGCFNFASTCDSDIFTIVNDKLLQRKIKSSSSVVNKTENSANAFPLGSMDKFFSLSIEELTELTRIRKEQMNEDLLPLPSVYINLAESSPTMFHDVKYSNFYDFDHSSEILETIKIDPRAETINTNYEAKLTELILSGKTNVNGTCHDFIFNITEPVLGVAQKRRNTDSARMLPYSVLETFSFKGYFLIIELENSTDNQIIESPNNQILPQLAASWLVTIFNAINARFIKPKLMKQDQLLFKTRKDDILKNVAVSMANYIDTIPPYPSITKQGEMVYSYNYGSNVFNEYKFEDILVQNFKNFQEFSTSSQSLFLKREEKNVYSHHIDLVFTRPLPTVRPRIQYFSSQKQKDRYNNDRINGNKIFNQLFIEQLSVKLLILTDTYGHPVNENEMKIDVDFELFNFANSLGGSQQTNQTIFIESFEKSLAENLESHVKSLMRSFPSSS